MVLSICWTSLVNLGHQIAKFNPAAGILKTAPRKFTSSKDNTWVEHQIIVTIIGQHEMRVRVLLEKALDYRDEIMEPIVKAFDNTGIHVKYLPPPRPRKLHRPLPFRRS